MYARFHSDWGHFKAGQCIEQHDKFVAPLVPAICTPITAAEYRGYVEMMAAIDREVERRVSAVVSGKRTKTSAKRTPRVVTQDQWRAELGQNTPNYWALAERHFRNKELRT